MNISEEDQMMTLKQTQEVILQKLLPAIVTLVIFCFIGLIGNIATIIFYAQQSGRSSTFLMITSLAAVDLAVCVAMILSILELSVLVTSYYSIVCKMTHFLGRWFVGSSCFVLWIISIDRYRKICKPFEKQVTVFKAKKIVTGFILLSLLLSVKELVHYSSIKIPLHVSNSNSTITGYYCKELNGTGYKISISVFNAIDMILFVVIWISQIVVYSLIIYNLVKIRNMKDKLKGLPYTKKTVEMSHGKDSDSLTSGGHVNQTIDVSPRDRISNVELNDSRLNATQCTCTSLNAQENISNQAEAFEKELKKPQTVEIELSTENSQRCQDVGSIKTLPNDGKGQGHVNRISLSHIEIKLTLMLFTVSLIFILCFTPYFIMVMWAFSAGKDFELDAGIKFAIRLPFLNSVFNPMIYFAFNADFRSFIKRLCFGRCTGSFSM
ncbi:D(2) dopamine receptor A-like [Ruditapes philippinarum]|uniref:D(2) dopamine receptor A-like n=1 Tax=Ruditapes philippinarum TaxID=129788 RepID=UPI00295B9E3E|nr:D(2) dopamine receptor A-like [Ruditapes philippinarum]